MAFQIKQNDTRPLFVVVLKDDFGEETEAPVNLTTAGGTAFFNMRAKAGGAVKISRGTALVTNAAAGEVTYSWLPADTDTAGEYEAELEVSWPSSKVETFPNSGYWDVTVVDDIA
jgi:hypothetical protein